MSYATTTRPDSHHRDDTYQPLVTPNQQANSQAIGSYDQGTSQYQTPNSYALPSHNAQPSVQNVPRYSNLGSSDGASPPGYNLVSPSNLPSHNSQGSAQAPLRGMSSDLSSPYQYNPHSTPSGHDMPDNRHLTGNVLGYANTAGNVHGVTIQTQDIDVNAIQDQNGFPLSFDGEFIPWLEYLPQDVINYFGEHQDSDR